MKDKHSTYNSSACHFYLPIFFINFRFELHLGILIFLKANCFEIRFKKKKKKMTLLMEISGSTSEFPLKGVYLMEALFHTTDQ
jgi:hypothetical protein